METHEITRHLDTARETLERGEVGEALAQLRALREDFGQHDVLDAVIAQLERAPFDDLGREVAVSAIQDLADRFSRVSVFREPSIAPEEPSLSRQGFSPFVREETKKYSTDIHGMLRDLDGLEDLLFDLDKPPSEQGSPFKNSGALDLGGDERSEERELETFEDISQLDLVDPSTRGSSDLLAAVGRFAAPLSDAQPSRELAFKLDPVEDMESFSNAEDVDFDGFDDLEDLQELEPAASDYDFGIDLSAHDEPPQMHVEEEQAEPVSPAPSQPEEQDAEVGILDFQFAFEKHEERSDEVEEPLDAPAVPTTTATTGARAPRPSMSLGFSLKSLLDKKKGGAVAQEDPGSDTSGEPAADDSELDLDFEPALKPTAMFRADDPGPSLDFGFGDDLEPPATFETGDSDSDLRFDFGFGDDLETPAPSEPPRRAEPEFSMDLDFGADDEPAPTAEAPSKLDPVAAGALGSDGEEADDDWLLPSETHKHTDEERPGDFKGGQGEERTRFVPRGDFAPTRQPLVAPQGDSGLDFSTASAQRASAGDEPARGTLAQAQEPPAIDIKNNPPTLERTYSEVEEEEDDFDFDLGFTNLEEPKGDDDAMPNFSSHGAPQEDRPRQRQATPVANEAQPRGRINPPMEPLPGPVSGTMYGMPTDFKRQSLSSNASSETSEHEIPEDEFFALAESIAAEKSQELAEKDSKRPRYRG
ncbi:MAG: hypothetical protein AAGI01_12455, partial [Myxococcota bacterium]